MPCGQCNPGAVQDATEADELVVHPLGCRRHPPRRRVCLSFGSCHRGRPLGGGGHGHVRRRRSFAVRVVSVRRPGGRCSRITGSWRRDPVASRLVPKPSPTTHGRTRSRARPATLALGAALQRVFGFEVLVCDRCGGRRRILGAVTEPHAVRRLLAALGLAAEPPPARLRRLTPARDRPPPGAAGPVCLPISRTTCGPISPPISPPPDAPRRRCRAAAALQSGCERPSRSGRCGARETTRKYR